MTVSLVKITPDTIVYAVGFNMSGCFLPDSESHVCATLDAARSALADELTSAADAMWDSELATAQDTYTSEDEYNAHFSEAHEGSTSISGSAEIVAGNEGGDVAWSVERTGGWSTIEPDGYVYFIHAVTLADAFGDDTESDEYLDVIDALQGR